MLEHSKSRAEQDTVPAPLLYPEEQLGLSGMAWFWIALFIALVIIKIFDSTPSFNPHNPARNKAVSRAVEEADIRTGFTLSKEEAERIAGEAFLREVRTEKLTAPPRP